MQNAGQYGHGAPGAHSSSQFVPSQTSPTGGSTTSSLRQFRKKDVLEKNSSEPSNSVPETHVARVAPHNHYPPKSNDNLRYYHQFPDYINGPPTQVKYSEIADLPHHQTANNVPTSVIQKPKSKEYMEMCNLQQQHVKPTYQEHLGNQQNYHHENVQYYPKETQPQVYSGYKPESQYYPKEHPYQQVPQQIPKYSPVPPPHMRKYPPQENPFLSKLRRIHPNMAMSIINDHSAMDQREMYSTQNQNRFYQGAVQGNPYNPSGYPMSHYQNYQNSCNYASRPPQMSSGPRFPINPHMDRSMSPRRSYGENLPMSMNYTSLPQKHSPNYSQYNTPEYSQHYQHRRAPPMPQEYLQQHYRPQYMQGRQIPVQEMPEIVENHSATSDLLKNYIENFDADEDAAEVSSIETVSSCKENSGVHEDTASTETVIMIDASELQYFQNNGIPLISSENGLPLTTEYIIKSDVFLENNKSSNPEVASSDRVVNIHITEGIKPPDCAMARHAESNGLPPNQNQNENDIKKIIVHMNTVLSQGNTSSVNEAKTLDMANQITGKENNLHKESKEGILHKETKKLIDKNCSPINVEQMESSLEKNSTDYKDTVKSALPTTDSHSQNIIEVPQFGTLTGRRDSDTSSNDSKGSSESPKHMPLIEAFADMPPDPSADMPLDTRLVSFQDAKDKYSGAKNTQPNLKRNENQDADNTEKVASDIVLETADTIKKESDTNDLLGTQKPEPIVDFVKQEVKDETIADEITDSFKPTIKNETCIVKEESGILESTNQNVESTSNLLNEVVKIQPEHAKRSFSVDDIMNNIGNNITRKSPECDKTIVELTGDFIAHETEYSSIAINYEKQCRELVNQRRKSVDIIEKECPGKLTAEEEKHSKEVKETDIEMGNVDCTTCQPENVINSKIISDVEEQVNIVNNPIDGLDEKIATDKNKNDQEQSINSLPQEEFAKIESETKETLGKAETAKHPDDIQYRHAIKIEDSSVLLHFAGELVEVSFKIVDGKKIFAVVPISESAMVDVNDNYGVNIDQQKSEGLEEQKLVKEIDATREPAFNEDSKNQINNDVFEINNSIQMTCTAIGFKESDNVDEALSNIITEPEVVKSTDQESHILSELEGILAEGQVNKYIDEPLEPLESETLLLEHEDLQSDLLSVLPVILPADEPNEVIITDLSHEEEIIIKLESETTIPLGVDEQAVEPVSTSVEHLEGEDYIPDAVHIKTKTFVPIEYLTSMSERTVEPATSTAGENPSCPSTQQKSLTLFTKAAKKAYESDLQIPAITTSGDVLVSVSKGPVSPNDVVSSSKTQAYKPSKTENEKKKKSKSGKYPKRSLRISEKVKSSNEKKRALKKLIEKQKQKREAKPPSQNNSENDNEEYVDFKELLRARKLRKLKKLQQAKTIKAENINEENTEVEENDNSETDPRVQGSTDHNVKQQKHGDMDNDFQEFSKKSMKEIKVNLVKIETSFSIIKKDTEETIKSKSVGESDRVKANLLKKAVNKIVKLYHSTEQNMTGCSGEEKIRHKSSSRSRHNHEKYKLSKVDTQKINHQSRKNKDNETDSQDNTCLKLDSKTSKSSKSEGQSSKSQSENTKHIDNEAEKSKVETKKYTETKDQKSKLGRQGMKRKGTTNQDSKEDGKNFNPENQKSIPIGLNSNESELAAENCEAERLCIPNENSDLKEATVQHCIAEREIDVTNDLNVFAKNQSSETESKNVNVETKNAELAGNISEFEAQISNLDVKNSELKTKNIYCETDLYKGNIYDSKHQIEDNTSENTIKIKTDEKLLSTQQYDKNEAIGEDTEKKKLDGIQNIETSSAIEKKNILATKVTPNQITVTSDTSNVINAVGSQPRNAYFKSIIKNYRTSKSLKNMSEACSTSRSDVAIQNREQVSSSLSSIRDPRKKPPGQIMVPSVSELIKENEVFFPKRKLSLEEYNKRKRKQSNDSSKSTEEGSKQSEDKVETQAVPQETKPLLDKAASTSVLKSDSFSQNLNLGSNVEENLKPIDVLDPRLSSKSTEDISKSNEDKLELQGVNKETTKLLGRAASTSDLKSDSFSKDLNLGSNKEESIKSKGVLDPRLPPVHPVKADNSQETLPTKQLTGPRLKTNSSLKTTLSCDETGIGEKMKTPLNSDIKQSYCSDISTIKRKESCEEPLQLDGQGYKNVEKEETEVIVPVITALKTSSKTESSMKKRRVSFDQTNTPNGSNSQMFHSRDRKQRTVSLDQFCDKLPDSDNAPSRKLSCDESKRQKVSFDDWEETQSPKVTSEKSEQPACLKNDFCGLLRNSKPVIDLSDFKLNTVLAKDEKLLEYKETVDSKLSSLNIQIPRIGKSTSPPKSTNDLMQRFLNNEKVTREEMEKIKAIISFKRKVQQLKTVKSPNASLSPSTYEVKRPPNEANTMKLHLKKIHGKRKGKVNVEESCSEDCDSDLTDISDRPKGDYSVVKYDSRETGVPKIIIKKRKPEIALPVVVLERIDMQAVNKKQKLC